MMASNDVPDYGANETQVDRLRARNTALRERVAELEELVQNIGAHLDDCRERYIPDSDFVMEVHYEIEDYRTRRPLDKGGDDGR